MTSHGEIDLEDNPLIHGEIDLEDNPLINDDIKTDNIEYSEFVNNTYVPDVSKYQQNNLSNCPELINMHLKIDKTSYNLLKINNKIDKTIQKCNELNENIENNNKNIQNNDHKIQNNNCCVTTIFLILLLLIISMAFVITYIICRELDYDLF